VPLQHAVECSDSDDDAAPPEGRTRPIARLVFRCCAMAAMIILLLGIPLWSTAAMIVPALSPFVLMGSWIAGLRTDGVGLSAAALAGLPVFVLVLARPRWFCRCACPVGLATDPVRRIGKFRTAFTKLPNIGRWLVLATIAGACLGCPLALWLDPLAIFSGTFSLVLSPGSVAGFVAAGAFLAIAASNLLWPGAWCLRICPLGATQDLLALPVRVIAGRGHRNRTPLKPIADRRQRLPRRSILSWGAGAIAIGAGAGVASGTLRGSAGQPSGTIRPPGAVGDDRFPWLCLRCGNCVRSCPEGIIHPDTNPGCAAGYLAPVIRFQRKYCREDCRRCTEVCPTGAIARLSLEEKRATPIGRAGVDMTLCLRAPENGEKECAVCQRACPYGAINFEFNYDTYVSTPRVDAHKCPGCGACEVACPGTNQAQREEISETTPLKKAIHVAPLG
jgi:ferredoxin